MTITITRADIENGYRCDPDCCPIGRALSRAGVVHYDVADEGVVVNSGQRATKRLAWPEPVRDWIVAYDSRQPVEPITFEISLPGEHKTKAPRNPRQQQTTSACA